jgi:hypothetical protein
MTYTSTKFFAEVQHGLGDDKDTISLQAMHPIGGNWEVKLKQAAAATHLNYAKSSTNIDGTPVVFLAFWKAVNDTEMFTLRIDGKCNMRSAVRALSRGLNDARQRGIAVTKIAFTSPNRADADALLAALREAFTEGRVLSTAMRRGTNEQVEWELMIMTVQAYNEARTSILSKLVKL